jgi:hypothetical protein
MQSFAIRRNMLNTEYGWENVFLLCPILMPKMVTVASFVHHAKIPHGDEKRGQSPTWCRG